MRESNLSLNTFTMVTGFYSLRQQQSPRQWESSRGDRRNQPLERPITPGVPESAWPQRWTTIAKGVSPRGATAIDEARQRKPREAEQVLSRPGTANVCFAGSASGRPSTSPLHRRRGSEIDIEALQQHSRRPTTSDSPIRPPRIVDAWTAQIAAVTYPLLPSRPSSAYQQQELDPTADAGAEVGSSAASVADDDFTPPNSPAPQLPQLPVGQGYALSKGYAAPDLGATADHLDSFRPEQKMAAPIFVPHLARAWTRPATAHPDERSPPRLNSATGKPAAHPSAHPTATATSLRSRRPHALLSGGLSPRGEKEIDFCGFMVDLDTACRRLVGEVRSARGVLGNGSESS